MKQQGRRPIDRRPVWRRDTTHAPQRPFLPDTPWRVHLPWRRAVSDAVPCAGSRLRPDHAPRSADSRDPARDSPVLPTLWLEGGLTIGIELGESCIRIINTMRYLDRKIEISRRV